MSSSYQFSDQGALACEIFDEIGIGLLITSPDGRAFLINRSLQDILGTRDGGFGKMSAEEVLKSRLAPLIREGDRIEPFLRAVRGDAGFAAITCLLETRSKGPRRVAISTQPLKTGPFQGCRLVCVCDITDRGQIPDPFEGSRLQAVFDHTPGAIVIADDSGRQIDVNPAACTLFGRTRDELLARTIFDFLPATERDAGRRLWEMSLAADELSGESGFTRSDGRLLWVEWRIVANVLPGRHLGFFRDITAQKHAESRLLHLAEIVEASDDGIVGLSRDGVVTSWNRGAEKIYGYTAEEAIGRPASAFAPPGPGDETRSLIDRLAAGEPIEQIETVRVRKDGTEISVSFTISPIRDASGRVTGASAAVRDTTRQKMAERALRESEAWFRGIYENAGIGMAITDIEGHLIDSNPAVRNMLGYRVDELSGMHFADYSHPDDIAGELTLFAELVAEERDRYQMEKRYVTRTGYVFWGRLTATLVRGGDGHPRHVIKMVEDIHERKQAETALVQRTNDLIHLIRRLEEAHGEANLYLDIMTHDIRNANNVSSVYADLLVDVLAGDQWLYARKLRDAIQRSTEILANVDTIRKIRTEAAPPVPVNLDAVIRGEIDAFAGATIRYAGARATVLADGLLSAVFTNLIGNAVKFGGPDVAITITVDDPGDGTVRASVEDTGPGVPDEVKEAIFHRFERGRATGKGEGLGLFICRILTDRYGGRIWVDDRVPGRPEEGAVFRFTLRKVEETEGYGGRQTGTKAGGVRSR